MIDRLFTVISSIVDENKPCQTDRCSDQLIPCQGLMVKEIHNQQRHCGQKSTLDDESHADLSACLIGINPACFQSDNDNPKEKGSPIQIFTKDKLSGST